MARCPDIGFDYLTGSFRARIRADSGISPRSRFITGLVMLAKMAVKRKAGYRSYSAGFELDAPNAALGKIGFLSPEPDDRGSYDQHHMLMPRLRLRPNFQEMSLP
jgi:hypothetical protein